MKFSEMKMITWIFVPAAINTFWKWRLHSFVCIRKKLLLLLQAFYWMKKNLNSIHIQLTVRNSYACLCIDFKLSTTPG